MVILGLGSNIGDRLAFLSKAVDKLHPMLGNPRVSRIYESPALLPPDATADMNMPFLNMVITGATSIAPLDMLHRIKDIEVELGRVQRCVWGPREIDIDILAYDDLVIDTPGLVVPHKQMLDRDFVMVPLADVAPDWIYPHAGLFCGRTAQEIVTRKGYGENDTFKVTGLAINA